MHPSRILARAAAVRVRYAPSPTGSLHLGGLRTALFNYLFARASGGTFILRIEDTDRKRFVPGSVEALARALRWCGLQYDEGPDVELVPAATTESAHAASCGPYVQSERLPLYVAAANELLDSGSAYRCFCPPERLSALREEQVRSGKPSLYDRACAGIPSGASDRRASAGEPHVVRLRVPPGTSCVHDVVLGDVRFAHAGVDDQVLLKSDGFPTYHLAAVVDDHAMRISHVIRGQEWLSSTPKHLLTYAALGFEPPAFAHLPLLLNASDRSKLSKRAGDASVEDFARAGYSPEGLVNFVALLGWTPPPGAGEVLSLEQLVDAFDLKRVNKANAVVDRARLDFFNGAHVKRLFAAWRQQRETRDDAAEQQFDSGTHGDSIGSLRETAAAGPIARFCSRYDTSTAAAVFPHPQLGYLLREVVPRLELVLAQLSTAAQANLPSVGPASDSANAGISRSSTLPSAVARAESCDPALTAAPSTSAAAGPATDRLGKLSSSSSSSGSMLDARTSLSRLFAVMLAQHERVHVAPEFVPLVLPFVANESEFREWQRQRACTPAFRSVIEQMRSTAAAAAETASAAAITLSIPGLRAAPPRAAADASPPASSSSALPLSLVPATPPSSPSSSPAPAASPSSSDIPLLDPWNAHVAPLLRAVVAAWGRLEGPDADFGRNSAPAMAAFKSVAAAGGRKPAHVMLPVRFALTGGDVGASLRDTLRLLGRDTCGQRLLWAAEHGDEWLPPRNT